MSKLKGDARINRELDMDKNLEEIVAQASRLR